jgi:hypothetical protein
VDDKNRYDPDHANGLPSVAIRVRIVPRERQGIIEYAVSKLMP